VDLEEFWALIERSGRKASDSEERAEWLTRKLSRLTPADIVEFQLHLDDLHKRADTWQLWGAAWLVCDGFCSDDGFWYFQAWLIGQGREAFEQAAADPDSLADIPAVRALAGRDTGDWAEQEWPDWESLDHTAEEAYEEATDHDLTEALEARGRAFRSSPEPPDEKWDFNDRAEVERRYPKLSRIFPSGAR
jgi:hypothetical protein